MKPALVLSGGGSRGAFAVGAVEVLPEANIAFDIIAGTSTGALIAPLLATQELQVLRGLYTSVTTDQIIRQRNIFEILATDSIYDATPLWQLINTFLSGRARFRESAGVDAAS